MRRSKGPNFFTVEKAKGLPRAVPHYTVQPEYPYSRGELCGADLRELLGTLANGPIIGALSNHVVVIIS
jgi:hypothetical protein